MGINLSKRTKKQEQFKVVPQKKRIKTDSIEEMIHDEALKKERAQTWSEVRTYFRRTRQPRKDKFLLFPTEQAGFNTINNRVTKIEPTRISTNGQAEIHNRQDNNLTIQNRGCFKQPRQANINSNKLTLVKIHLQIIHSHKKLKNNTHSLTLAQFSPKKEYRLQIEGGISINKYRGREPWPQRLFQFDDFFACFSFFSFNFLLVFLRFWFGLRLIYIFRFFCIYILLCSRQHMIGLFGGVNLVGMFALPLMLSLDIK